jgi:hypothetical protein
MVSRKNLPVDGQGVDLDVSGLVAKFIYMFPIVKPVRLFTSSRSNRAKFLDKDQNNDGSIFLESEPLTDHKEVKRGWNLV